MDIEERLESIEKRLEKLEIAVIELKSSNRMAIQLIKYVVLPLIVIVGALVGVKIVLP